MKSWAYFSAAVFFASYLLLSNGAPFLPVLAGCAVAALSMWIRMASARKPSSGSVGH
jgi:hypothetical protein